MGSNPFLSLRMTLRVSAHTDALIKAIPGSAQAGRGFLRTPNAHLWLAKRACNGVGHWHHLTDFTDASFPLGLQPKALLIGAVSADSV